MIYDYIVLYSGLRRKSRPAPLLRVSGAERRQGGAPVVVGEDGRIVRAFLRHDPRAVLAHAHAMAEARRGEDEQPFALTRYRVGQSGRSKGLPLR